MSKRNINWSVAGPPPHGSVQTLVSSHQESGDSGQLFTGVVLPVTSSGSCWPTVGKESLARCPFLFVRYSAGEKWKGTPRRAGQKHLLLRPYKILLQPHISAQIIKPAAQAYTPKVATVLQPPFDSHRVFPRTRRQFGGIETPANI